MQTFAKWLALLSVPLAAWSCTPRSAAAFAKAGGDIANAQDGAPSQTVGNYVRLSDDSYLIVLLPGAKMMQSLTAFQAATHIEAGSLSGVGVTRNTVLGFYKFNEDGQPGKTHTDDTVKRPREVVSLNCNFTTGIVQDDNAQSAAPPHCHIALAGDDDPTPTGRGWSVVGGHLIEAEVAVTAELIVRTYPATVIKRPSAAFGGFLIDADAARGGTAISVIPPG